MHTSMLGPVQRAERLALPGRAAAQLLPARHGLGCRLAVRPARGTLRVAAELSAKGRRLPAEALTVKRIMGEGSYGQVFEGTLNLSGQEERVVLKRVKEKVEGAEEMGAMEHLLNVYANSAARGSVADFLGYAEVADEEANRNLTRGLWLAWRYEGYKTLHYYVRHRNCVPALAKDLGVEEAAAVPTVMQQLLEGLSALHSAGLIHRDVKPLNIIFAEQERRFKLIDLGACADLRTGTNYVPDESILDPHYCPPEQYCLPTDAPHLARQLGPLALAMSPMLWAQHQPDRFDSFSAGLVLMQLAVPRLRTTSALKAFKEAMAKCDHDLDEWRQGARLPPREAAVLDADDGAGWELAGALLRPRSVEVDDKGNVRFANQNGAARLTASGALKHRFLQQAARKTAAGYVRSSAREPAGGTGSGGTRSDLPPSVARRVNARGGSAEEEREPEVAVAVPARASAFSAAFGVWKKVTAQLYDLEAKVMNQAVAQEKQTTMVKKLRQDVQRGRAEPAELERAERSLEKISGRLDTLTSDFATTSKAASRLFGGLFSWGSKANTKQQLALPPPAAGSGRTGSNARASSSGTSSAAPASGSGGHRRSASRRAAAAAAEAEAEAAAAAEAQAAASNNLGTAASNALYAGLKFTGLALNVATDLATALRKDAEKAAEPQPRLTADNSRAFMEMLREAQPPLTSASTFSGVAAQLADDERFAAVPASKRAGLFDTYMEALAKLEAAERDRVLAEFKELLEEADVNAKSTWYIACADPRLTKDERWRAVKRGSERRRVFTEHVKALRSAAEAEAALAAAEAAFRTLLDEVRPPIVAADSWAVVRRRIWSDPRYEAVVERRRREIFAAFQEILRDVEQYTTSLDTAEEGDTTQQIASAPKAAAAAAPSGGLTPLMRWLFDTTKHAMAGEEIQAAPPAEAPLPAAPAAAAAGGGDEADATMVVHTGGVVAAGPEEAGDAAQVNVSHAAVTAEAAGEAARLASLASLKSEQSRLKSEYDKMEAKLKEMEARLRLKEMVLSSIDQVDPLVPVIMDDNDGSTLFRFPGSRGKARRPHASSSNGTRPAKGE